MVALDRLAKTREKEKLVTHPTDRTFAQHWEVRAQNNLGDGARNGVPRHPC